MSIILSWQAEEHLFGNSVFGSVALPSTFVIALFSNNLYPAKSNVYADFTPATTPDTDYFNLAKASFTSTQGSASNRSYSEYNSDITFAFTGYAGTEDYVYGYYIAWNDGALSRVLVSERFATPQLITAALSIVIRPKIEFGELL